VRRTLTAALLLLAARGLSAQSSSDEALRVSSRLVIVPTLVQTPAREVVYSLLPEDFLLTDQGVPQKVSLNDSTKQPLSLVVLMQTGGAAVREFDKYRGLEAMLADILGGSPNQAAIVNFDSRPAAASEFTSDIARNGRTRSIRLSPATAAPRFATRSSSRSVFWQSSLRTIARLFCSSRSLRTQAARQPRRKLRAWRQRRAQRSTR
jgi:hypothetical protein